MSHLVDDNGGLHRFPVGAGVYLITHEPSGERYVGQSRHVRTRLAQHLKNGGCSSWVRRRAARDIRQEFEIPDHINDLKLSRLWDGEGFDSLGYFIEAVKRNSDAELLDAMPGASEEDLLAAERQWIRRLRPELNGAL